MSDTVTSPVPPVKYEVHEFAEGDAKGFKFTAPEFATVAAAIERYGESILVNVINSAVLARIRTKVKNDLGLSKMKPQEIKPFLDAKLAKTNGLLFTETDAFSWKPEVRELSPKQLFKQATELLKAGKAKEAAEVLQRMQALMLEQSNAEIEEAVAAPAEAPVVG